MFFNGNVGWLTNDFTHGKLLCQKDEIIYISEADYTYCDEKADEDKDSKSTSTEPFLKTFHTFPLPKGTGWDCIGSSWGSEYIFPSENDIVNIKFKI